MRIQPLFSHSLLVVSLVVASFTQGCAAESAETSEVRPSTTSPGARLALGVMGIDAMSSSSSRDSLDARRYRAVAGYITAEVERRNPGHLDIIATDVASSDPLRTEAAFQWLNDALESAANSTRVLAAVKADALFAGSRFQSLGEGDIGIRNTGGGNAEGSGSESNGNVPDPGKGADGRYGDDRTGLSGAVADAADLAKGSTPSAVAQRAADLVGVDNGSIQPDPNSRLGAYAATAGYPDGTVGSAVHNAIGTIYAGLGTYGEENIGRVFNSSAAQSLYGDPVDSQSGLEMAQIEHNYWQNVAKEDPYSAGGKLGSAFNPTTRDWLQKNIF
jgi:hypothetical protein